MKKLLSTILVLAFVLAALSTLAPMASANSETISESEAKELIVKAYEFCQNVRADHFLTHEISDEYRIEVRYGEQSWARDFYWLAKEENLPGGSYEKMCEYAETIYTSDIAARAYAYKFNGAVNPSEAMWEGLRPLFHRDENGVLYSSSGVVMSYDSAYLYPNAEDFEIEIVSGDSKTAKANIPVYFNYIDGPRTDAFDIVECRFEKLSNGWRIADSEYSLVLATEHAFLEDYRAKNPDEGNPSGGGILIPDVREIMLPFIGDLKQDIDKYYYWEFCNDSAVDKLVAGCKATVEKVGTEKTGDEYIVTVNGEKPLRFVYDPDETRIEIVESTDKEATILVYFDFIEGDKRVSTPVECKFSRERKLWMLEDSQLIDLLTWEFDHSDAKALVDAAVASRKILSAYYPNHMNYVQGAQIDYKELYVPAMGQKFDQLYVTLMEQFLPGGSYEAFLADTRSVFTESVAKRYNTKYYHNNSLSSFITRDGVRYIAAYTAMLPIGFRYDPESSVIEMLEVTENTATANVYCYNYVGIGDDRYDFYVECKFVKTADGWRIAASDFANMLCSSDNFKYTVVDPEKLEIKFRSLISKSWDFYNTVIRGRVYQELCDYSKEITVTIDGKDYTYWLLKEEKLPGRSYEAMVERAKSIYAENIAEKMYAYPTRHKDYPEIPAFYFADDGKIYTCLVGQDYEFADLNCYELFFEDENHPFNGVVVSKGEYEIRLLEYTSDWARAYVRVDDRHGEYTNLVWLECEFIKENGSWVISDSSYTDMLRFNAPGDQDWRKEVKEYDGKYALSPATGDNAYGKIAVCLGGMAVVMSALSLVRRRREE